MDCTTEYMIHYSVCGQPFITTHGTYEEALKHYEMHLKAKDHDYTHIIKVTKYYEKVK